MSEASADLQTPRRAGALADLPVAATTALFTLTLACISGGYVVNPEDGSSVSGYDFAGVVRVGVDNSTGAAGDEDVELYTEGDFLLAVDTIVAADVGKEAYLVDNATVCLATNANSTGIPIGTIVGFEDGKAWVAINDHSGVTARAALRPFTVSVAGPNAAAIDLSAAAVDYGGAGFRVESVVSMLAIVTSSNAWATPPNRVATTDWTLAAGVISTVNDETANTLLISFIGYLVR